MVFAAAHDPVMGRGVWVRLYGGRLENRMAVDLVTGCDRVTGQEITVQRKISQIRDASGKDTGTLESGRAGVVYGLGDIEIGHVFGDAQRLPRKVQPGLFRTPLITVQVMGVIAVLSARRGSKAAPGPAAEAADTVIELWEV